MFKRLTNAFKGKKPNNSTRKNNTLPKAPTTTLAAEDPKAPPAAAAWTPLKFPEPPSTLPMPQVPKTDPQIVMEIKKLQLPGFVLPEKTFQMLYTFFEKRISSKLSTPFSIQYAIQQALQNAIVDKETIYALLNRGDRSLEQILPLYLKKGGAIDVDVYNTVYPLLIRQYIQQKSQEMVSSMPVPPSGAKGGRRTKKTRKQRKSKKSKKTY